MAADLVGLDFQAELLECVRQGYGALVEGDVHRMPLRDHSFAGAIAANTLHHIAQPVSALREIRRVLRPGAPFLAYDPRTINVLEWAKKLLRRNDHAFTEEHHSFRADEYQDLLGQAGFVVEYVRTRDPVAPLVAAGLDLLHVGRSGLAAAIARVLARADRTLMVFDQAGNRGLMVVALARTPS